MRIASTAEQFSKTVKAIIDVLPSLKLSPDEQKIFLSLAKNLDDHAQLLQKQAKQNHIDAIDNTMNQISATCASCIHYSESQTNNSAMPQVLLPILLSLWLFPTSGYASANEDMMILLK